MILDLDIGNTLSKWRLKDGASSEIRSRGAVWTREEWKPGADIPDLDVLESVRISSVARQAVLEQTVGLLQHEVKSVYVARSTPEAMGVVNGYEEPHRLGVDRWLGVLAGYQLARLLCCRLWQRDHHRFRIAGRSPFGWLYPPRLTFDEGEPAIRHTQCCDRP